MLPHNPLKYSLLVPCYNAGVYIDSFWANLSRLNKPFDEVIFYDDASTDDTVQRLTGHGCIVIRGLSNQGPGYARNKLAKQATSNYIHFHDIDDEFSPGFLTLIDSELQKSNTDVILGNADWIEAETRNTIIHWRYNEIGIRKDPISYFLTNPLGVINTVYNKQAFVDAGGFNEQINCWEDADLHIRIAFANKTFSFIDQTLAYSIRHNSGISSNQTWCWQCRLTFLENYTLLLDEKYHYIIAAEFEKAAYNLVYHNRINKAVSAFKNSRKFGKDGPSVNNSFLRGLKSLSPLSAFLLKAALIKIKS